MSATELSWEWVVGLDRSVYFKALRDACPTKNVKVKCCDGYITTTLRHLQFAWGYLQINKEYNAPVCCEQIPGPDVITDGDAHFLLLKVATTQVYNHLNGEVPYSKISQSAILAIEDQINTGIKELEPYAPAIDAEDYVELMDDPAVEEIRDNLRTDVETGNTKQEKGQAFSRAYDKFFGFVDEHGITKYRDNGLTQLNYSGTVKRVQVSQGLVGVGYASEVNSEFYNRPVIPSYSDGMTDPFYWLANARSASKALMYQDSPMKDTEYLHRLVQMTTSCFKRLYLGDCGSTVTYPFLVTKRYAKQVIGKYFIEDGVTKCITEENYREYIGRTIRVRFVSGCKVKDHYGVCLCCAGAVGHAIEGFNVGHVASTRVYGAGSQNVLSVKHSDMTSVGAGLQLADGVQEYLKMDADGFDVVPKRRDMILILPAVKTKESKVILGSKLHNVRNLTDEQLEKVDIHEMTQFSQVQFEPRPDEEFKMQPYEGPISANQEDMLNLSLDALRYIRDNEDMVGMHFRKRGKRYYYIDLSKFPEDKPLFRARFAHLDTLTTFGILQSFIKKLPTPGAVTLAGQRTFGEAAEALMNIVNDSLKINLSLIELSIYAHTVNDPANGDFRPSRKGNEVQFEAMDTLFNRRSFATKLISERLTDVMVGPSLFTQKHRVPGLYDVLLGK